MSSSIWTDFLIKTNWRIEKVGKKENLKRKEKTKRRFFFGIFIRGAFWLLLINKTYILEKKKESKKQIRGNRGTTIQSREVREKVMVSSRPWSCSSQAFCDSLSSPWSLGWRLGHPPLSPSIITSPPTIREQEKQARDEEKGKPKAERRLLKETLLDITTKWND